MFIKPYGGSSQLWTYALQAENFLLASDDVRGYLISSLSNCSGFRQVSVPAYFSIPGEERPTPVTVIQGKSR